MILGLVGNAGVGKSTLTTGLLEYLNHYKITANKHSFADALRNEIYEQAISGSQWIPQDAPNEVIQGYLLVKDNTNLLYTKPYLPEVRRLLQWWGTEFRRAYDSMYWVKAWCRELPWEEHIIIDDVRFMEEGRIIRGLGGTLVRLYRDVPNIAPVHKSEDFSWLAGNTSFLTYTLNEPQNPVKFWDWLTSRE